MFPRFARLRSTDSDMARKSIIIGFAAALSLGLGACSTVGDVLDRGDTGESARSASGKSTSKQGAGPARPRKKVKDRAQYQPSKKQQEKNVASKETSEEPVVALAPVKASPSPAGKTIVSTQQSLEGVIGRAGLSQKQVTQVRDRHLKNIAQYEIAQNALVSQLKAGVNAGDPVLLSQWYTTQSALNQVTADLNGLNGADAALRSETATLSALKAQLPPDATLTSQDSEQVGIVRKNIADADSRIQSILSDLTPLIDEKKRFVSQAERVLEQLAPSVRGH